MRGVGRFALPRQRVRAVYPYEAPIRRHAIQLSSAANDGSIIAPKGNRGF